jgi:uncharacterized protein YxjI
VLRDAAVAGASTASTRYLLRSRDPGDEIDAAIDAGQVAFRVDRSALEQRGALILRDARGSVLFALTRRLTEGPASVEIRRPGGQLAARIRQSVRDESRASFEIEVPGSSTLHARGDIANHEYRIERDRSPVAEVSKRWSMLGGGRGYAAQVLPGQDDGLALAVVLGIDLVQRSDR